MKSTEFMEKDMVKFFRTPATASILAVFAMPVANAQTVTSSVRLAGDLHPQSELQARTLLDRVKNAADEACGASKFSVAEYSRSIRHSPCWQQSVSDTVAHIANPVLSDIYGREAR